MKLKLKKKSAPVASPSKSGASIQVKNVEEALVHDLMKTMRIRRMPGDEQQRIFGAMSHDVWSRHCRCMDILIAIEDSGTHPCICRECGGKCPHKIPGTNSLIVCYDCTFGRHFGKQSSPATTTAKTERTEDKNEDVSRNKTQKHVVPQVARRTGLRIRRRKH